MHPKFLKKAEHYLGSIEGALREFNEDFRTIPESEEGYYWNPILETVEPSNHSHSAGNTFVIMYAITKKEEYRVKAEYLARYFLASIFVERNGSYVWGYSPTSDDRIDKIGEYVWKGHVTISFPLLAYDHGLVFDESDIQALTRTFLDNIYPGNYSFNRYIGIKKTRPLCFNKRLKKSVAGIPGWISLDAYNPEIRVILENTMATRTDLIPGGWFQDTKTAMAYSHRLRDLQ